MPTSKRGDAALRHAKTPANAVPRLVACIGLKSSGSTWLYNVIAELLKAQQTQKSRRSLSRTTPRTVMQFYADSVESFPVMAEDAPHIVVKAHVPSRSLEFLLNFNRAVVFLTVREPRDSVASVLQRFGHRFDDVLREIGQGSEWLTHFAKTYNRPVLRYEEKFYEREETVAEIAKVLKVKLPRVTLRRIYDRHTPQAVKRKIRALEKKGAFGETPHPDKFHPASHWHPGHVGDLAIGKYDGILSVEQQRAVLRATQAFCRAFGYSNKANESRRTTGRDKEKKPSRSRRNVGVFDNR